MAKIPFSIKYRPQIESGEYKVETEEGSPARIICWDSPINKERPIIAIVFDDQIEQYKANGRYDNDYETTNYDLFLVTTDPELSEFESKVKYIVDNLTNNITYRNVMKERFNRGDEDEQIKEYASELLALARKELEPKIKSEALRTRATELTKNLTKSGLDKDSIPYHLIEFMCNLYDCQNWKEI